MTRKEGSFKVGDIVCYRRSFLQSVCWYTDVPKDGRVEGLSEIETPGGTPFPQVLWCDRKEPIAVHPANLILKKDLHLEPA